LRACSSKKGIETGKLEKEIDSEAEFKIK